MAVLTEAQERIFHELEAVLHQLHSLPVPSRPVKPSWPYPALQALVGMLKEDVRRRLGQPFFVEPGADDGGGAWHFDFSRRPSHSYRGGGLNLVLHFDSNGLCLLAQWRPQR